MSWLVWGGFVRTVFVLHSTWLVNSATHVWGYRSHATRDNSTNLWWVALLTYGEGWHNNHHAYQTSARHGLRWWEVDMTYIAIRLMKVCGIAYDIRLPKIRSGRRARPRDGDGRLSELIAGDGVRRTRSASPCLVFRRRMAKMEEPWQSGPSSTAEQGTHQKKVAAEGNLRREPGELRET